MWAGLAAFCAASPISIAATNMAWAVALSGLLIRALHPDARAGNLVHRTDLDAPLLCFVLASFLSVLFSLDLAASIVEFRSLGLMVIYFLFAWQARTLSRRKLFVQILVLFSCVSALYGWVQWLTGWDLLGHYRPESGKVCGTFGLHLTYGEYLSMVLCVGTGILLYAKTTRLVRWASTLPLVLLASSLFLSGAKGAWLGLVVGLGVVCCMRGRKALALYVTMGILGLAALDVFLSHQLWQKLAALFQVQAGERFGPAASNAHRLCMWWTGLWISLDHFVSGVGLHALERIYPAFRHPLAIEPNQWHLHNNFVHIGVTRGMLGLAAFLYIFIRVFRLGFFLHGNGGRAFDRGLAAGVLGAAAAFLVAGLTEYNWGDSEVLMLLYMLLGLLASCEGKRGTLETREPPTAHAPIEQGSAPEALGCRSRILLLGSVTAGLCGLVLFSPWGIPSFRTSLWEAIIGICLFALAFGGRNRLREVPLWQKQVLGGLAVCAGYRFTQGLWSGRQWLGAEGWTLWVGLSGFVAVSLRGVLLFRDHRSNRGTGRPVDLAAVGAVWVWSGIALGTYGLLRAAGWQEPLLGPPYLPVLLLTLLAAILYSLVRFTYSGTRVERLFLILLGLCTLAHLLR
jgi:O-antigen ligase